MTIPFSYTISVITHVPSSNAIALVPPSLQINGFLCLAPLPRSAATDTARGRHVRRAGQQRPRRRTPAGLHPADSGQPPDAPEHGDRRLRVPQEGEGSGRLVPAAGAMGVEPVPPFPCQNQ